MKTIAKEVDMVAWFDKDGVHPTRFRLEGQEGNVVIKVDKVIKKDMEKLAGKLAWKFTCQSAINGQIKLFELKYMLLEMKWILFKI